jgi:hypothetical protein
MSDRPQKITFADMRDMGVRGLLIYCSDYKCSHLVTMSADRWPDELRLSEIKAHGRRLSLISKRVGAQSRPLTMSAFLVRQVTIY